MFALTDTILAVASAPGWSPRGIVRCSGDAARTLLRPHLHHHAGPDERREERPHRPAPSRHWRPARLVLPSLAIPVLTFDACGPRSYTGQDSAELQLPGNPHLLQRVVDALVRSGSARHLAVRRAEPGEFTARAYLNGRLSLTQAEGVAATIAAQSDAELRAARLLTSGALGSLAHRLADDLAGALALVEAGIDFTDQDDVVPIAPAALTDRLRRLHDRITAHLARAVGCESLRDLPWVVITGRPNAGKSTLFNALLGRQRAVVSPVAGTTRDVLAEPLAIATPHGAAEIMLVDLAGLDQGDALMNRAMQLAASSAIDRADLIVHCVPIDAPLDAQAHRPPAVSSDRPTITVRTKCDLHDAAGGASRDNPGERCISAVTAQGVDDLRRLIAARLAHRAVSLAADALALSPRHDAALRSARDHLAATMTILDPMIDQHALADPELIAASLRAALDDLGQLAGDVTPDDLLGRIFASFCIGK